MLNLFLRLTLISVSIISISLYSCGDDSQFNYGTYSEDIILEGSVRSTDTLNTQPLPDTHTPHYNPDFDEEDLSDRGPDPDNNISYQTQGSGGKDGNYEEKYTSSGTYTVTSYYKMRVPKNIHELKPHGLLIYLHGDGGNDYRQDFIFGPLVPIAHNYSLIAVSVLSPNNGTAWYQNPEKHAYFLHSLLEDKIFKEYNIDTSRIYLTGSSGGSQFITGIFVPKYVGSYGGGAFPSCGGADIYNFIQYEITDHMKDHFKLYYYTQTRDFLYPQVTKSMATYESLGMKVSGEFPKTCQGYNRCHCEFKLSEVMVKAFEYFNKD